MKKVNSQRNIGTKALDLISMMTVMMLFIGLMWR